MRKRVFGDWEYDGFYVGEMFVFVLFEGLLE